MFTPLLFAVWLTVKKFLFFAVVLGVGSFQIATWDGGKQKAEEAIRLNVPETSTTLVVYSKRSSPVLPEFDRRMEILIPGKPTQSVELKGDTSGDNLLDVFVKREHVQLRLYITSPRYFAMEERMEPGSTGVYPDISDKPTSDELRKKAHAMASEAGRKTTADELAEEFPTEKYWIYYDGIIPRPPGGPSKFKELTKIGHFDTRHNRWVPK